MFVCRLVSLARAGYQKPLRITQSANFKFSTRLKFSAFLNSRKLNIRSLMIGTGAMTRSR